MKTVIIMSHPYYENSRTNKALFEAAKGVQDVTIRHLEAIYGFDTRSFDVKTEQNLLQNADKIVFQFPVYWLSAPAMLKGYMDAVLSSGFAFGEGAKLGGKELQLAVSTGSSHAAYSKEGYMKHTLNEILLPFQITADYCGMTFNRIFVSGGTMNPSSQDLQNDAQRYVKLLKNELEEE